MPDAGNTGGGGGSNTNVIIALITAASGVLIAMISAKVGPFAENPPPAVATIAGEAIAAQPIESEESPVVSSPSSRSQDGAPSTFDVGAQPLFGTVELGSGFQPDPHSVSIAAGGNVSATSIEGCLGYASPQPDVRVTYQAGTSPLAFQVQSEADTTLIVNAPDGSWKCNDDRATGDNNPLVRFDTPQTGQYDVWIGTFSSDAGAQSAELRITEIVGE